MLKLYSYFFFHLNCCESGEDLMLHQVTLSKGKGKWGGIAPKVPPTNQKEFLMKNCRKFILENK